MNRTVKLLVVAIVLLAVAVPTAGFAFASVNMTPTRMTADLRNRQSLGIPNPQSTPSIDRGFPPPNQFRRGSPGNVTIDATQAKTLVSTSLSSLKVGAVSSLGTGWVVPLEDAKGVVTSIQVAKVSASTADQAKSIVENSLKSGWKTGDPKLMGTMYSVPILDSNNMEVGSVRVDGKTGEIMRRPSTVVTVTSDQAKSKVNDAIKEFKVGDVKDRGSTWTVNIQYKDRTVMTVLLGKVNTLTSDDAVKAVQYSLKLGWNPGAPKLSQFAYNVPITDINNNIIGNIRVDGRTGDITAGFPSIVRQR